MTRVQLSKEFEMDIPKDICQVFELSAGQRLELTVSAGKIFLTPLAIVPKAKEHDYEERKSK